MTSVLPSNRAPRVAHVLADTLAERRAAVERNDARVVDHLVGNDHAIRRLQDTRAVAVDGRPERPDGAARDAAIVEAEILHRVPRPDTEGAGHAPLPSLGQHRWESAVRRIDDHRRVTESARALLVTKRADGTAVLRFARAVTLRAACRKLFVGQVLPRAELLGTLLRNAAHVVRGPDSLQIGMAPRRRRRRPARIDARSRFRLGRPRCLRDDGCRRDRDGGRCADDRQHSADLARHGAERNTAATRLRVASAW